MHQTIIPIFAIICFFLVTVRTDGNNEDVQGYNDSQNDIKAVINKLVVHIENSLDCSPNQEVVEIESDENNEIDTGEVSVDEPEPLLK